MNNYASTHKYRVCVLKQDHVIFDKFFPASSVILIDEYRTGRIMSCDVYVCVKMPTKYKGDFPNLGLFVCTDGNYWEFGRFRNHITKMMWKHYCKSGKPAPRKDSISDAMATQMMRQKNIVHKSGTGTRINTHQITDALRYKQVTESAYWANLSNGSSGNASVVCSGCYNGNFEVDYYSMRTSHNIYF